ncbi:hypothetical protein [Actinotalea sp. K2]|uniref:hypothetical protein n=1 Tax=Actinotalea sp. K2 TaxID=2939438 RepID=UPI0020180FA6|nr:hypothetical protein [Actinotalea sp. K2]MCL3860640.1 hypothetical protein [Actinotalea sp. K2]
MADATEFALRLDRVAPATDRDALMQRYAPLPEPTYSTATPAQQAAVDSNLPSQRVAMVVERLDAISDQRSDVDPGPRAAAAYAMTFDRSVIHDPTSFEPAADGLRLGKVREVSLTGEGGDDPALTWSSPPCPGISGWGCSRCGRRR